jgi:hypothetical protein
LVALQRVEHERLDARSVLVVDVAARERRAVGTAGTEEEEEEE